MTKYSVSSGQVSSQTLTSDDLLTVFAGGVYQSASPKAGGTIIVSSGGLLQNSTLFDVSVTVSDGGRVANVSDIYLEGMTVIGGGIVSGLNFEGGLEVYGTVVSAVLSGGETVYSGGISSKTVIASYASEEFVRAGGQSIGDTVTSNTDLVLLDPTSIVTSDTILPGGGLGLAFLPYVSGASATIDAADVLHVTAGSRTVSVSLAGVGPSTDAFVSNAEGGGTHGTFISIADDRVAFTDTVTHASGIDDASIYTGPVNYLHQQYIWGKPDGVALAAVTSSVFLVGGAGDDALQVSAGNNVLDGGSGSNFLVGAHDSEGVDTFFVDTYGGGPVWSTIVNFHYGDAVTLWGFHPGVSTQVVAASDGTAGYTGYTIHSELNGAGTGVNASLTLAGISQADVAAHISIVAGTLNAGTATAQEYLYLTYNR